MEGKYLLSGEEYQEYLLLKELKNKVESELDFLILLSIKNKDILTIDEACIYLSIGKASLYKAIKNHVLDDCIFKRERSTFIIKERLNEMIMQNLGKKIKISFIFPK